MRWIAEPILLTSAELDVGVCSASSMTRPPDVDRTPIAREAAEDRGVIRRRLDGRRTVGGGGGAGTGPGASHRIRPEGSGDRDAVRHLFLALCRRYGLSPYRLHRQRRNTVMVRAPRGFVDQVLWPEFGELDRALRAYLHEVTLRVIRDEVFADASEAQEVPEALPPN